MLRVVAERGEVDGNQRQDEARPARRRRPASPHAQALSGPQSDPCIRETARAAQRSSAGRTTQQPRSPASPARVLEPGLEEVRIIDGLKDVHAGSFRYSCRSGVTSFSRRSCPMSSSSRRNAFVAVVYELMLNTASPCRSARRALRHQTISPAASSQIARCTTVASLPR